MTSQGSAYARFRRALKTGNLTLIRNAAAELPRVDLGEVEADVVRATGPDDADPRIAVRELRERLDALERLLPP